MSSSSAGGSPSSLHIEEEPTSSPLTLPPPASPSHASSTPVSPTTAAAPAPALPPPDPTTRHLSDQDDVPFTLLSNDSQAASSQCTHSSKEGKILALCVDGTSNQFGMKNTNVVELYARLIKDEKQLTYYNSGIGTYAKPSFKSWSYIKQVVDHKIDMAIAWRFESIIHAAYEWLSENYQPGDRIFLFGFSRGAYQVRVIAGMIHRVGLLHKGNKSQIPFAYELYASSSDDDHPEDPSGGSSSSGSGDPDTNPLRSNRREGFYNRKEDIRDPNINTPKSGTTKHNGYDTLKLCRQFKKALCHENVKVHFVGAWDTVSSIGIARGTSLPDTTIGMKHVCAFRHALALDERRVKFQPEYVNGGSGPSDKDMGNVKEVWFAGSHSDIGGGVRVNDNLNNFGPALRWMTYEAMNQGLKMRHYQGTWEDIEPTESLTSLWAPLELIPFRRLSYQDENSSTYVPHFGAPRRVQPGQLIHESVLKQMEIDASATESNPPDASNIPYRTKRTISRLGSTFTRFFRHVFVQRKNSTTSGQPADALPGMDGMTHTTSVSSDGPDVYIPSARLPSGEFNSWKTLHAAFMNPYVEPRLTGIVEKDPFATAKHALDLLQKACENILQVPKDHTIDDDKWDAFDVAMNIVRSFVSHDWRQASMAEVPDAANILLTALKVNYRHRLTIPPKSKTHDVLIQLLSSFPHELPHWRREFKISEIQEFMTLLSEEEKLKSWTSKLSGILQNFGSRILETPYVGSSAPFICFSTIKTGSILMCTDTECAVWDHPEADPPHNMLTTVYKFPEQLLQRLSSYMRSYTVSVDGGLIAFGMRDPHAVAIIDVGTETTRFLSPLDGSEIVVVCFSPDSTLLASGFEEGTVILWKVRSNTSEPRQFRGHTARIRALAFSPNNSHLASASDDHTVRVWAVSERNDPIVLVGHHFEVFAVSWSPSGKRIASGGRDGQIITWNLQGNKLFSHSSSQFYIFAIAFSPDGRTLVTGGLDDTLRAWSCQTQKQLWCFNTRMPIVSIAFSPEAPRLVTGEYGGTVSIWDVDLPMNEPDTVVL